MQQETVDIGQELAEAPIGAFHWRLCIIIGLIVFFDGYDVFTPGYIIHDVAVPWDLRPAQAGLLVSSGLVGFLAGSNCHGRIADRIGRRVTLLGALWISGVFTLATALFATSFTSFCLLRMLTGLGLGVLFPLGITYINEFAPRRAADVFPLWGAAFGWSLGCAAAGLTGVLATPVWGWQSLYYIGSLSLPLALAGHFVLPVGRIGGILGPFIVGGLQQLHSGTTISFLAIGAAVLAAAISLGLGAEARRGAAAPAVV